jgi:hypothetical protein
VLELVAAGLLTAVVVGPAVGVLDEHAAEEIVAAMVALNTSPAMERFMVASHERTCRRQGCGDCLGGFLANCRSVVCVANRPWVNGAISLSSQFAAHQGFVKRGGEWCSQRKTPTCKGTNDQFFVAQTTDAPTQKAPGADPGVSYTASQLDSRTGNLNF